MQVLIGGVIRDSKKEPIAVKFSVTEVKNIIKNAKNGELVLKYVPKGTAKPKVMDEFITLRKHKSRLKKVVKQASKQLSSAKAEVKNEEE